VIELVVQRRNVVAPQSIVGSGAVPTVVVVVATTPTTAPPPYFKLIVVLSSSPLTNARVFDPANWRQLDP
jgi:hypothetical protein